MPPDMFSPTFSMFLANHSFSLLFVFLLCYILQSTYYAYGTKLRTLPGPTIARFTRLYHISMTWNGNLHQEFQRLHAKYGPVVRSGPNHVSISDPDLIPVIFGISSKFVKSDFYIPYGMRLDGKPLDNMFSVRDQIEHKHLKTPVAGTFALSSIRQLEPLVDECTDIFIAAMTKHSPAPVDFSTWLQWYAFDVVGAITFLKRFGFMEEGKDISNMIRNLDGGMAYISTVSFIPELHRWLLGNDKLMKVLNYLPAVREKDPFPNILSVTKGQIKEYDEEQRTYARGDMLSWIREQRAKSEDRMNERDLINHLTSNLLAGSDTTAIGLRAIFYYVLKTPAVLAKLMEELETAQRESTISPSITLAEGLRLPYLQAVIKEAMRVHPGVGASLWRITPEGGATICGKYIPQGTEVGMNAWVVHKDKKVFGEDADIFRPERWLDSDEERIKAMDRAFFSFGYGARTCIGKNISMMEMSKFVPQLLLKFEMEWAEPNKEWTVTTRFFAKQSEMTVILRPRDRRSKM